MRRTRKVSRKSNRKSGRKNTLRRTKRKNTRKVSRKRNTRRRNTRKRIRGGVVSPEQITESGKVLKEVVLQYIEIVNEQCGDEVPEAVRDCRNRLLLAVERHETDVNAGLIGYMNEVVVMGSILADALNTVEVSQGPPILPPDFEARLEAMAAGIEDAVTMEQHQQEVWAAGIEDAAPEPDLEAPLEIGETW
jgi:hypothetical protein